MNYEIIIIGAGASGLIAASFINKNIKTIILEKNSQPGKKLLATGTGKCNYTVHGDIDYLLNGFPKYQQIFLKHSFYQFPPEKTINFFKEMNVKPKIERGNRIFPESENSKDILNALLNKIKQNNIKIHLNSNVNKILKTNNGFQIYTDNKIYNSKSVIITTGGLSMKRSGCTGDGYKFAEQFGHTLVEPQPSLSPLLTSDNWIKKVNGLKLKNVKLHALLNKKISLFGELYFFHNGIEGPITLELSRFLKKTDFPFKINLDLKPALNKKQIDNRILREINKQPNMKIENLLSKLIPYDLIKIFIEKLNINTNIIAHNLTKNKRKHICDLLKCIELSVTGFDKIEKAMVTKGGIKLSEINRKTMESKLIKNLFFAGETLDIDGDCGGYNLQAAWSTGFVAAINSVKNLNEQS